MKNGRILYLDALRVFSIIAVVFVHICAMDWYSAEPDSFHWQVLNFYDGLFRFCVPVFIMISGAFLLNPDKKYTIKSLFTKKISRVLVAFLFWSAMYIIVCHTIEPNGTEEFVNKWLSGSTYHLWFPYAIISMYLITPFLREIVKSKKLCEYFILLWFIGASLGLALRITAATPEVVLTLRSKLIPEFVLGYSGYFVLGYYLSKYNLSKGVRMLSYLLAAMGLVITIAGTAHMSLQSGEAYSKLYEYMMPNTAFVSCGVFILFKSLIKDAPSDDTKGAVIAALSKLSFGVYLVHEMFIYVIEDVLKYTTAFINPVVCVPLIALVVLVLSVVVTYIMSKIPVVNKYLM